MDEDKTKPLRISVPTYDFVMCTKIKYSNASMYFFLDY